MNEPVDATGAIRRWDMHARAWMDGFSREGSWKVIAGLHLEAGSGTIS